MPESLLYLIKTGRLEEAFRLCQYLTEITEAEKENFMCVLSNLNDIKDNENKEYFEDTEKKLIDVQRISFRKLSENPEEKENLVKKEDKIDDLKNTEENLKDKNIVYIIVMIFAFFNSYLIQGIRYILPKTLSKVYPKNAWIVNLELQISSVAEGIAAFMTGILIEIPTFKRLKILMFSIFSTLIFSFLGFFLKKNIDIYSCILKTTITVQDQVLEVYSTELFETENRVFMLSIFNIFNSIPVFLSPMINDIINHQSFIFTYFWFGVIALTLFFLGFLFKNETYKTTLK